ANRRVSHAQRSPGEPCSPNESAPSYTSRNPIPAARVHSWFVLHWLPQKRAVRSPLPGRKRHRLWCRPTEQRRGVALKRNWGRLAKKANALREPPTEPARKFCARLRAGSKTIE